MCSTYDVSGPKNRLQWTKFIAIGHDKANKIAEGGLIFVYLIAEVVQKLASNFSDVGFV